MVKHQSEEFEGSVKIYNLEERESVLGFRPQKEIIYNTLLPYADRLDEESNFQFEEIKSQIGRAILLRDVKVAGIHWIGQLSKYIRLFGMKFSFEDHVQLIKLLYEVLFIPDLHCSLIQKYAITLTTLLKKAELIPRKSLVLPWRPLYLLYDSIANSPYEHHGMVYLPDNIESTLKNLIRACRVYFSAQSTQEMLTEWRPLMCPFDVKMMTAMSNYEHFLPTLVYKDEHASSYKLWFGEFVSIYCTTVNSPSWELSLVNLFSRLSQECVGHIHWKPYLDQIFTRILREFDLPVGSKRLDMRRRLDICDVGVSAKWIIYMISPKSKEVLSYTCKLFKALDSFYHPSNYGKWSNKLLKFLSRMSSELVKRLEREKWKSTKESDSASTSDHVKAMKTKDWRPEVPAEHRLTEDILTTLVNCMCPALMSAMFSKSGSCEAATTFKNLSTIRPEIVIPPLLDWTYSALETLIEPHRLTSCLQCTVSVLRSMVVHSHRYPEGPLHVIPLLQLSLPGIDPNDLKKSLMTFQLITTLTSLIPIVDCSEAPQHYKDLTKHEKQLCSATADFEGVILLYFDRVISMIENSSHHYSRTDTATSDRMSNEEVMLELCLLSSTNSLLQQTSLSIFQEVLRKLITFAFGSSFETRVAGRFTSKLIKAASKARPELVLPKFVPRCCALLTRRLQSEDLCRDEHLDNEVLWLLMLLSEVVACDGLHLVPFAGDLTTVLELTLTLKCKEAAELSGTLLKNILRATSSIYATDYRSTSRNLDSPISKHLPIREWGKSSDPFHLNMKWHIPSPQEKEFVDDLLGKFLIEQLDKIKLHCVKSKSNPHALEREDLCRRLNIIHQCLFGACALLPMWNEGAVQLVRSPVALSRFSLIVGPDDEEIMLQDKNVRLLIAEHMILLLEFMHVDTEDDTKSLHVIIKIINALFHTFSSSKEEFDGRWKARHHIKHFMANKLIGKKKHIRSLLVDRIQLQHDLRSTNQSTKYFTTLHQMFYKHLFQLATSRYMEIRKAAQSSLAMCFRTYAYSYQVIVDDILTILGRKHRNDSLDHQLKGTLYVILGESKQSLATRRNWELMNKLWPALVLTPHCEKTSINLIHDAIVDKIHKDIETVEIAMKVTLSCINLAEGLLSLGRGAKVSSKMPSQEEMNSAEEMERQRNDANQTSYYQLVDNLTNVALKGNLYWRFQQVCFELLSLLIRHDIPMPCSTVQLFVTNMNNTMISIRKISIHSVSALLKQQKRPHLKTSIEPNCSTLPYGIANCIEGAKPEVEKVPQTPLEEFDKAESIHSAGSKKHDSISKGRTRSHDFDETLYRPPLNNGWMFFWSKDVPNTEEAWNDFVFINKTHVGYYAWPKPLTAYQPISAQPKLGRFRDELSDCERPIYDAFNNPSFVNQFIKYISLEEHKGKESFHPKYFTFFKGLFRNFDTTVLSFLKEEVETLVSKSTHENQESHHRCAAEIIAGLLRGSKHWTFQKRQEMWLWLIPLLEKVLHNLSVENVYDWGTCIATASENQDPRKLAPLFDLLMENPLSEVGGSFGDSSRLYLIQGLLAQQEWRVPELLHKLLTFLTLHLKHLYKNVRDRIGSLLVNIFLFDVSFYVGFPATLNPRLDVFLELVIPKLLLLTYLGDKAPAVANRDVSPQEQKETKKETKNQSADSRKSTRILSVHKPEIFLASEDVQKGTIRFFKTFLKGLQGVYTRICQTDHPDVLKLLPVMASLESYTLDVELSRECSLTMLIMSQSLLQNSMVIPMLEAIEETSRMSSWHARSAILTYLQKLTFGNLFLLQKPEIVTRITSLLLVLVMDDQIEVRELAGVTLSGLFQCGYIAVDEKLLKLFRDWSSAKIRKRTLSRRSHEEVLDRGKPLLLSLTSSTPLVGKLKAADDDFQDEMSILKRHAGVIGICACVAASPYDVPPYMPELLVELSYHLNDPQPIQMTVKRTLGGFKRTHHESWHDHKQKFTDDQLAILTELLVSPNYYA